MNNIKENFFSQLSPELILDANHAKKFVIKNFSTSNEYNFEQKETNYNEYAISKGYNITDERTNIIYNNRERHSAKVFLKEFNSEYFKSCIELNLNKIKIKGYNHKNPEYTYELFLEKENSYFIVNYNDKDLSFKINADLIIETNNSGFFNLKNLSKNNFFEKLDKQVIQLALKSIFVDHNFESFCELYEMGHDFDLSRYEKEFSIFKQLSHMNNQTFKKTHKKKISI